jgi:hypothetical protein
MTFPNSKAEDITSSTSLNIPAIDIITAEFLPITRITAKFSIKARQPFRNKIKIKLPENKSKFIVGYSKTKNPIEINTSDRGAIRYNRDSTSNLRSQRKRSIIVIRIESANMANSWNKNPSILNSPSL